MTHEGLLLLVVGLVALACWAVGLAVPVTP